MAQDDMHIHARMILLALLLALPFTGCASRYPRRDPVGETFPSLEGTSLDGHRVAIPEAFAGQHVLLLVGYRMETQFDLDRWLLALTEADLAIPVYELPTIPGLIPGLFASRIDAGMRSGIPEEDWATVVTVYDDAEKITRFLGNEVPLPGRIILLNPQGRVLFFHDRGYSVGALQTLRTALKSPAPPD